ncbi:MAG: antitermination protein NusB [Eggerthellaceae bacterium]|nr:antitermination protein NusB [Eggerthellaceae bacterium]
MSRLSPARVTALRVTTAARERDAFVGEVLDGQLSRGSLSPEDRAFARTLSLGVATTWGTLDEAIDKYLHTPNDIKADVRDALRISVYEILFLHKEDHAAVDQGVELVRSVTPKAAGLANAVLRKISTGRANFPYGNPKTDMAAFARLYGFPQWITRELVDLYGHAGAEEFMKASNLPAPLFIAVNAIRAKDADVIADFATEGIELTPVHFGGAALNGCYRAPSTAVATNTARDLFAKGAILVSDAAAQAVAQLTLPAAKPSSMLEIGSGRGTKTILLQSGAQRRWGSQVALTCVDSFDFKAKLLESRASTYGVQLDQVISADARNLSGQLGTKQFDAVFVDAPCSGLGTLRRHPEIRWKLTRDKVGSLSNRGFALLSEAARYVAPGGQLTYSTCTITREENELVIKEFLESKAGQGFGVLPTPSPGISNYYFKPALVSNGCDAHFAARLKHL